MNCHRIAQILTELLHHFLLWAASILSECQRCVELILSFWHLISLETCKNGVMERVIIVWIVLFNYFCMNCSIMFIIKE